MQTPLYKITLTFFFSTLLILGTTAQTRIWSPYSRYGIGELSFTNTPFLDAMGGTSSAYRSNYHINFNNPASYSAFEKQTFLFDGAVLAYPRISENETTSAQSLYSGMSHLTFGFPATPKWGFSFGLIPYSSVGYNITNTETIDSIGDVDYVYEGWGGVNNFYMGTGYEFLPGLSAGVNMNYYFGKIERRRLAYFDTTGFTNSRLSNKINISDIHFVFGLQYNKQFSHKIEKDGIIVREPNGYDLTIGLSGGNSSSLKAKQTILSENFAGTNPLSFARDTILYIQNERFEINMPLAFGGGASIRKAGRWMFGVDGQWQNWSEYTFMGVSDSLTNSIRVSAGGWFIPSEKPNSGILRRTTWLFGTHYYSNYLELKNSPLVQYGISFGMSMPVRRTRTALNLSFEVGRTGTTDNQLIEETYGKIKIGVNISERWFTKRKFD